MEWRPGVTENLGYYVYLLSDPRSDRIFYVGKGIGSRCFSHIWEARKTTRDSRGDYEKLATIRGIEESGTDVRIEILRHGLTEDEAFHLEAAAMDLLGFSDLDNRVVGHGTRVKGRMGVDDINAPDPERGEVLFGDGLHRKRPPSGSAQIRSSYRFGGGAVLAVGAAAVVWVGAWFLWCRLLGRRAS